MDDFFTEIRDVFDSQKQTENSNDSASASLGGSIFAEALAPINPSRWPGFTTGSAVTSDMPEISDKISTLFNNIVVAKEYLESSKSDIQYRERVWEVVEDTVAINVASESGGLIGEFGTGVYSNECADKYMNKMMETEITLTSVEKLNEKIFQQEAGKLGVLPQDIRGTGILREFVPEDLRGDLCDRLTRDSQPNDLENADGIIVSNNFDSDIDSSTFQYKEPSTGFFGKVKSVFSSSPELTSSYLENDAVCLSNDPDGIDWEPIERTEKSVGFCKGMANLLCGEEWSYCPSEAPDIPIFSDDAELAKQNADLNNGYCADNQSIMDKMLDLFGFGFFSDGYAAGAGSCGEIRDPSLMMPPSPFLDCAPPPTE